LTNQKIEEKIELLLSRMTIEEKVGQMVQRGSAKEENVAKDKENIKAGKIGSILNTGDAKEVNAYQRLAVEESRLGIPLIIGHDVIHGFLTTFPIPLAQACSWDLDLIEEAEAIAAKEAATAGIRWTFSPMVDVARDARWGRVAEGAGEDAYLGSMIAKARVRGFQRLNEDGYPTVAACVKHFAGYGAAEGGRDYSSAEISERTMRDIYLPPFKAAIDAGCLTLMAAFHDVSGVPCSGSKFLLTDVLVKEWGFDGFVLSDWGSVNELESHGVAANRSDAGKLAAEAGIHMDMHENTYQENLKDLLEAGLISQECIDNAVRRVLRVKFALGLFEKPYTDESLAEKVNLCDAHVKCALELARESVVLLKNEKKTLPLRDDVKKIGVIGPMSDSGNAMLGCWQSWGKEESIVTIFQGIKQKISKDVAIEYARGCEFYDESVQDFSEAIKVAQNSDIVIMSLGEGAGYSGENRNRMSLGLPGQQQNLLEAIHKIGKPIVLVVAAGRPLSISWAKEHVQAIVYAWHLGNQAGNAIADVLFGDFNPSGKLAMTIPRSVGQSPIFYNKKNFGKPTIVGYIDGEATPLYPFGYGQSYTTFQYSDLVLSSGTMKKNGEIKVSVNLKNTGKMAGEEIVQLYVRDLVGSVARPIKELKGFEKLSLKKGEQKTVTFSLKAKDLGLYGLDNRYIVEKGDFKLWVGPNSDEGLEADFKLI